MKELGNLYMMGRFHVYEFYKRGRVTMHSYMPIYLETEYFSFISAKVFKILYQNYDLADVFLQISYLQSFIGMYS